MFIPRSPCEPDAPLIYRPFWDLPTVRLGDVLYSAKSAVHFEN